MPRRLGPTARAFCYGMLCHRDGEHCELCFAQPTKPLSKTQNEPFSATRNEPFDSDSGTVSASRNGQSRRQQIVLEIDHINGKHRDWRWENLRLLCKPCNVAESNRRRSSSDFSLSQKRRRRQHGNPATQIVRNAVEFSLGPPQMQANALYEPRFRNWLLGKFRETGAGFLDKEDVINSGAEVAGCSTATAITYLKKLTSSEGALLEQPDLLGRTVIMLKPEIAKGE